MGLNGLNGLELAAIYGLNRLEFGKKILMGLKKKFGWARFGPKGLNGARGTQRGRFRPRKKKKKKKPD